MSRNPSAIKVNEKDKTKIPKPGRSATCGAFKRADLPPFIVWPQSGSGGWIPNPIKLKPAPKTIPSAATEAPYASKVEMEFGKICLTIILVVPAPVVLAESINSKFFILNISW